MPINDTEYHRQKEKVFHNSLFIQFSIARLFMRAIKVLFRGLHQKISLTFQLLFSIHLWNLPKSLSNT